MSKGKAVQAVFKFADEALDALRGASKGGRHSKVTKNYKRKWPEKKLGTGYETAESDLAFLSGPRYDYVSIPKELREYFYRLEDGSLMLKPGKTLTQKQAIEKIIKSEKLRGNTAKRLRLNAAAKMKDNELSIYDGQSKALSVRGAGRPPPGGVVPDEIIDDMGDFGIPDEVIDIETSGDRLRAAYAPRDMPEGDFGRVRRVGNQFVPDDGTDQFGPLRPEEVLNKRQRAARFFKNAANRTGEKTGFKGTTETGPIPEGGAFAGAYSKADSATSNFFKNRFNEFRNAGPGMKALGVIGGADLGMMAGMAGYDMLSDSTLGKAFGAGVAEDRELSALLNESKRAQMLAAYEQAKNNKRIEENAMSLARNAPDIFEQVMSGRMLPTDGKAIGGQRRVDLLSAVANRMGTGLGVPQVQEPNELLNALLGGGAI